MEDLTSYLIVGFLSFALGVFGHIIREKITYYFLKRPKVKVSLEGKNGNYSSNKNLQGKYFFCYIPNCTVRLTNNGTKAITLVSVHLDTSIENQKVIGQYDERGTLKNNGISLRLEPDDSKTLNLGFKLENRKDKLTEEVKGKLIFSFGDSSKAEIDIEFPVGKY